MTSLSSPRFTEAVAVHARKPAVPFIAAWILAMIALPIARWILGDPVIPFIATVSAVFQFAAVLVVFYEVWSVRRLALTAAAVAVLTWGAEWLGSTTGFPFGVYSYTELLQPQLFGVPLLIPLAWLMTLGPAWAVAYAILGGRVDTAPRRLAFAALSGAAMVAWDLYLDPQMTGWGFWIWEQPGAYFGIPLVNFLGWFGVASLVTLAVHPVKIPVAPLLVIYGVIWAFQAMGLALFWGQPGPALFGFVGMGAVLAAAITNARRTLWTR